MKYLLMMIIVLATIGTATATSQRADCCTGADGAVVAGLRGGSDRLYVRLVSELSRSVRHGEVVHLLRMVMGHHDHDSGAEHRDAGVEKMGAEVKRIHVA